MGYFSAAEMPGNQEGCSAEIKGSLRWFLTSKFQMFRRNGSITDGYSGSLRHGDINMSLSVVRRTYQWSGFHVPQSAL